MKGQRTEVRRPNKESALFKMKMASMMQTASLDTVNGAYDIHIGYSSVKHR